MNTTATSSLPSGNSNNSSNRPLWAAVGVLAIAVLGMGGMLIYQQSRPTSAVAEMPAASQQAIAAAGTTLAGDDLVAPEAPATPAPAAKPAPVQKAAPKPVVRAPVPAATSVPAPQHAPVANVCGNCGTITAVTPVTRKGEGTGLGAIGGGVAGAVLGNQVGGGSGRALATVLGAVGGGYAGNAIEKNVRKTTSYQVQVRMDDGSTGGYESATSPAVGTRVVRNDGVWRAM